ncbi:GntR family transcriptional regulator [Streptomyces violaceusniger]|uniref:Transcriptional regulator, GntR family n=1 Tax=Streptomyces violaceusniger (strain Tu 4113) TaxID=653045 RepID=G2NTN9_STRV4|nr:GntR family transcriptional regulator [Streptomyces violaceusniger]AEM83549.1 transcriptional regulator, GntR family [Streptomyces violaceusniger Tu 4113]
MPITSLQQRSLGDLVAHELRVLIVSGRLRPGTHLVEGALAEQYDVSRGPVRDALRQLEAEGLVEARRRGVFVTGLTEDDVEELYTLRESLETLALTLAIGRAGPGDWEPAERFVRDMRDAADRAAAGDFALADLEFHSQFYVLSGHRRLLAVWEQYRPTFGVILDVTNAQDVDLRPFAGAHADLLATVRAGDVEHAATTLREHLLGARNRLRAALRSARAAAGRG